MPNNNDEKEDLKNVGFNIPSSLLNEIDQIGREMGLNRSSVFILSCREFVDRRKNPDKLKDMVREILREDPTLLDESLQRIGLKFYVQK
jgi:hypothetical protein